MKVLFNRRRNFDPNFKRSETGKFFLKHSFRSQGPLCREIGLNLSLASAKSLLFGLRERL